MFAVYNGIMYYDHNKSTMHAHENMDQNDLVYTCSYTSVIALTDLINHWQHKRFFYIFPSTDIWHTTSAVWFIFNYKHNIKIEALNIIITMNVVFGTSLCLGAEKWKIFHFSAEKNGYKVPLGSCTNVPVSKRNQHFGAKNSVHFLYKNLAFFIK